MFMIINLIMIELRNNSFVYRITLKIQLQLKLKLKLENFPINVWNLKFGYYGYLSMNGKSWEVGGLGGPMTFMRVVYYINTHVYVYGYYHYEQVQGSDHVTYDVGKRS